jgi:hypothetical protein
VPTSLLQLPASISHAELLAHAAAAAAALDERWSLLEDACAFAYRLSAGMPLYRPHDDLADEASRAYLAANVRPDEWLLLQTRNQQLLAHVVKRLQEHAADAAAAAAAAASATAAAAAAAGASGEGSASCSGADADAGAGAGAFAGAGAASSSVAASRAWPRPSLAHRLRHAQGVRALVPELARGWSGLGTPAARSEAAAAVVAAVGDAAARLRRYRECHAAALAAPSLPPAHAAEPAVPPPARAKRRREFAE